MKMPKGSKRLTNQSVPLWAQIVAVLWMVGVLLWFFTDPKIQHWLAMMFADLLR